MSNSDIAAEARTLIAQQLYSDAIALLADHLDLSPNHTAAWELIAVAYSKLGDWQDALDAMEQVLADKSDSALAWSQYGMALRKTGDFSGARKAQVQALTIDPDLELGIIELRKIKRDQGGRHKKRRPTTYCPKCGYALAPTDAECPRCITRRNQARDLARDLATEQAAYAAPAMPTAPVFSEVAEAADGSQYIAKVPQQDPSMPAAPAVPYAPVTSDEIVLYPSAPQQDPFMPAAPAVPTATPYVKNVPQPSAQFPQPPQIPIQPPVQMPMPDASPYAADAATARTFTPRENEHSKENEMETLPVQSRAEMMLELETKRQEKLDVKLDGQLNTLMIVLAVVYPLIGLFWGAMLSLKKIKSRRIQGAWLFLAATAGIILWWLIWTAWGDPIVKKMLFQLIKDFIEFMNPSGY